MLARGVAQALTCLKGNASASFMVRMKKALRIVRAVIRPPEGVEKTMVGALQDKIIIDIGIS